MATGIIQNAFRSPTQNDLNAFGARIKTGDYAGAAKQARGFGFSDQEIADYVGSQKDLGIGSADAMKWLGSNATPTNQAGAQTATAQTYEAGTYKPQDYQAQTYQASTYNPQSYEAKTYNATNWNVSPDQLAENRIQGIVAKNSPLMQLAETQALQGMNGRGLVNSSMAVGAAQNAVLGQASEIGRFDAGTLARAGEFNANAANEAGRFNTGELNTASRFNADASNEAGRFNAGALNEAGRFNTGELNTASRFGADAANRASEFNVGARNDASRFNADAFNTTDRFNVGELNQFERDRLGREFQSGESALDRSFRRDERVGGQDFTAGESALDRAQQTALQDDNQGFTLQRDDSQFLRDKDLLERTDTLTRRREDDAFVRNRALQGDDQTFRSGQNELDRAQRADLQSSEQTFRAGESALDRQNRLDMAGIEQAARGTDAVGGLAQQVSRDITQIQTDPDLDPAVKAQMVTAKIDYFKSVGAALGVADDVLSNISLSFGGGSATSGSSGAGSGSGTTAPRNNFTSDSPPATVNSSAATSLFGKGYSTASTGRLIAPDGMPASDAEQQAWNRQKDLGAENMAYLANNPDVAKAVMSGAIPSGEYHWQNFGRFEPFRSYEGVQGVARPAGIVEQAVANQPDPNYFNGGS